VVTRNDIDSAFKSILTADDLCFFQVTLPNNRSQVKVLHATRGGMGLTVRLDRYLKNSIQSRVWKNIGKGRLEEPRDESEFLFRVRFMCVLKKSPRVNFNLLLRPHALSSEQIENLLTFETAGNRVSQAILSVRWSVNREQVISISANRSFADYMGSEAEMAAFLQASSKAFVNEMNRIAKLRKK